MRKVVLISLALLIAVASTGCKEESPPITRGRAPSPVDTEKEIALLKEIISKDPGNQQAWIRLGNMSMDARRYQEAIPAYQKALEMDPDNVDVRVDMGTSYRNIGEPEKAVEAYRKAISINPDHANAHRNLAVVLAYDLGLKEEAAGEFEEYLRIVPNVPDAAVIKEEIARLRGEK